MGPKKDVGTMLGTAAVTHAHVSGSVLPWDSCHLQLPSSFQTMYILPYQELVYTTDVWIWKPVQVRAFCLNDGELQHTSCILNVCAAWKADHKYSNLTPPPKKNILWSNNQVRLNDRRCWVFIINYFHKTSRTIARSTVVSSYITSRQSFYISF